MVDRIALETSRLRLRSWHDDDLEPLAQLCADPEVMRYDPALLSRDECAALMVRSRLHLLRHGFGLWALERKDSGAFIGYCGLVWAPSSVPGSAVELRWAWPVNNGARAWCSRRHGRFCSMPSSPCNCPRWSPAWRRSTSRPNSWWRSWACAPIRQRLSPTRSWQRAPLHEQLLYRLLRGDWRQ